MATNLGTTTTLTTISLIFVPLFISSHPLQTSAPRLPSCHVWVTTLFVALSCSPLYCVAINKLHVTRNRLLRHALPRRLPEAPLNLNCSRGISLTLMLTDAHPASSTAVIGFNLTQSCLLMDEPKLCSLNEDTKRIVLILRLFSRKF